MTHLNRAELVDYVEASPALSSERRRHVASCEACRAQAEALGAVRALAQADEARDPSPLFWDHFAARVAEAVRDEAPGTESPVGARWRRMPLATWAATATIAMLVMMTLVWRSTLHAPGAESVSSPATETAGSGPAAPLVLASAAMDNDEVNVDVDVENNVDVDVEHDEAWAVVRTAAEDLGWDDVHAEGLDARLGAAEAVALELTADERIELARLLDQALKRNGV